MEAPLVDFHCHLDLYPDFEQVVEECEREHIYTLAVTTTPRAWPRNQELTRNKKYVRAALGLHPQLVGTHPGELQVWDAHFPDAKYIGEIGLDAGPRYFSSLPAQIAVFEHILRRCSEMGGKVITIHSVRAARQVIDLITKHKTHRNNRIVLHWFTGTISQMLEAASLGCYFSINKNMFTKGSALVSAMPMQRMLTETDGPFTTLGNHPQRPNDVSECVRQLGIMLHKNEVTVREMVSNNLGILLHE